MCNGKGIDGRLKSFRRPLLLSYDDIKIEGTTMNDLFKHPVWAMAFRPFTRWRPCMAHCLYCFGASAIRVHLNCRVY